jgi:hypothetical protein
MISSSPTMTQQGAFAQIPSQLLGRRFVSEDRTLYFLVREAREGEHQGERFPLRLEVGRPGGEVLMENGLAEWIPRKNETSSNARERLDRVTAELGTPNVGPTYTLLFTRRNDEAAGFRQVALRADTPVEAVEVFPEYGGTPYGASEDEWDWKSGWWHPYSTFRVEPAATDPANRRAT